MNMGRADFRLYPNCENGSIILNCSVMTDQEFKQALQALIDHAGRQCREALAGLSQGDETKMQDFRRWDRIQRELELIAFSCDE